MVRFLIFLLSLFSLAISVNSQTEKTNTKVIIFHNNDLHARFEQFNPVGGSCTSMDAQSSRCYGGFPRIAYMIRHYRNASLLGGPNVFYLNAGDTFSGSAWFSVHQEKITSEMLNALKPDAMSLGNHEFDLGISKLENFLGGLKFPVLAANLDLSKFPKLDIAIKKSIVLEANGLKIGVIGYLTPQTPFFVNVEGIEFREVIPVINEESRRLKLQGVDVIIALGHTGLNNDTEIAFNCPDVDLVIGGHSHSYLSKKKQDIENAVGPYPLWVIQTNGKRVPVVQAFEYGKYLGFMELTFDAKGNLIDFEGEPFLLNDSIPQEMDVLHLLEKYRPGVEAQENIKVGTSYVMLDGPPCMIRECQFGNLVTDAMVSYYVSQHDPKVKQWTDTAIAFYEGGGFRSSIEPKTITQLDLLSVFPFKRQLVQICLSGKTLKEVMEWSIARYGHERVGEFLQVSGIHIWYDLSKPTGSRVRRIDLRCANCSVPMYIPLNETKYYNVITTDYLANGSEQYHMLKEKEIKKLGITDSEAVLKYIRKMSPVYPAVEGRIVLESVQEFASSLVTGLNSADRLMFSQIAFVCFLFHLLANILSGNQ